MGSGCVITVGNFDGVHIGHRKILAQTRSWAAERRCPAVALAFDPHPATTLRPGSVPPRLINRCRKEQLLRAAGADRVTMLEPSAGLLSQTADQFVEGLVATYRPFAIVEGEDFRFGKGRCGDMDHLGVLGCRLGFETRSVPRVEAVLGDRLAAPVSSSLVRWLVGRGRVADAAACLGRPFELAGRVVSGERRGRFLGVPTANLDPGALAGHLIPADGVYAGLIETPDGGSCAAAISVGDRPTFDQPQLTVEAHLLDFDEQLYGQTITIRFALWLRDQYAFPGVEALKAKMDRDIALTRQLHACGRLA